jgi:hypothetical protein
MRKVLCHNLARELIKMPGSKPHRIIQKIALFVIALTPLVMICATAAGHSPVDLQHHSAIAGSSLHAGSVDDEINEACRDCNNQAAVTCSGKNAWDTFWCTLWERTKCVFTSCAHTYPETSGP